MALCKRVDFTPYFCRLPLLATFEALASYPINAAYSGFSRALKHAAWQAPDVP